MKKYKDNGVVVKNGKVLKSSQALTLALLTVAVQSAFADELADNMDNAPDTANTVNLGVLQSTISTNAPPGKLGEQVVGRHQLNQNNIQSNYDLVRYNTEVDVAEMGRYGNKGFSIRGVDNNRVNINIDGIALPESEANEIFSPYGYMYEGRFNPDLEVMGAVKITAGADSLTAGSGAVGGAITYKTKEPENLFKYNDHIGGYTKIGYSNKNEETLTAFGLSGKNDNIEMLFNYAYREGSETKNHAMRVADDKRLQTSYVFDEQEMPDKYSTSSLIYPNPKKYTRHTALAKAYYHINDEHRIGLQGMYQNQDSLVNTDTANLVGGRKGKIARRAYDKDRLSSYGLGYRYTPTDSRYIDTLTLDYSKFDVLGLADTWIYNRDFDYSTDELKTTKLDYRAYRPTKTITHQLDLLAESPTIDLSALGEHQLKLKGSYSKQDYSVSALALHEDHTRNLLDFSFVDGKKDNYNVSLSDKIRINERLKALLGVRYDHYKYHPYYEDNVGGFSEKQQNEQMCKNESNTSLTCQNLRAGKTLADTSFAHTTYSAMVDYEWLPKQLSTRYKIGTGFLAPTITQIYSNFVGFGAKQVPNYALKPEKSLNQEIELEYRPTPKTLLNIAAYNTRYTDFIHTRYWHGETNGCDRRSTCLQSVNLDTAEVSGLKLGASADVSSWINNQGRLNLSANYHAAKDKAVIETDNDGKKQINTLATTPANAIFGADYFSGDETLSLHARVRVIEPKRAKDTKTLETKSERIESGAATCSPDIIAYYGFCPPGFGSAPVQYKYTEYVDTYKHIDKSKKAVVVDLYGSKRFGQNKNMIVNAGVYNLTNVNYIPWESLRQFNNSNANSLVDSDGYGFARYSAPGRNYAISLTYEF